MKRGFFALTTPQKIESAATMAQSLHASLAEFTLDTLEPAQKAAYQELTNSAAFIHQRLQQRLEQLFTLQANQLPKS